MPINKYTIKQMPLDRYWKDSTVIVELANHSRRDFDRLMVLSECKIGSLFFFHGIFRKSNLRASHGASKACLRASLKNFQSHFKHGPSDVDFNLGKVASGVVAFVPEEVLPNFDAIEGTPAWYARFEVPLVDKEAENKVIA